MITYSRDLGLKPSVGFLFVFLRNVIELLKCLIQFVPLTLYIVEFISNLAAIFQGCIIFYCAVKIDDLSIHILVARGV